MSNESVPGKNCEGKWLLTTKYARKFGLPPEISCVGRQLENHFSSWRSNTVCNLADCPSTRRSEEFMQSAMEMAIFEKRMIDDHTVFIP